MRGEDDNGSANDVPLAYGSLQERRVLCMNIQRLLSPRQTGGKGAALRAKGGQAILPPDHFVESERVTRPASNQQTLEVIFV